MVTKWKLMGHARWLLQYLTSGVRQSKFYPKTPLFCTHIKFDWMYCFCNIYTVYNTCSFAQYYTPKNETTNLLEVKTRIVLYTSVLSIHNKLQYNCIWIAKFLFFNFRYFQCFDLEGESGIVARGIGTVVNIAKISQQPPSPQGVSPLFKEYVWFYDDVFLH
jgi:hypothetical protein